MNDDYYAIFIPPTIEIEAIKPRAVLALLEDFPLDMSDPRLPVVLHPAAPPDNFYLLQATRHGDQVTMAGDLRKHDIIGYFNTEKGEFECVKD